MLWSLLTPDSLSRKAAEIILDENSIICVSAASAWEIATKVRLGKLPHAEVFEKEFLAAMDDAGYLLLPISVETRGAACWSAPRPV